MLFIVVSNDDTPNSIMVYKCAFVVLLYGSKVVRTAVVSHLWCVLVELRCTTVYFQQVVNCHVTELKNLQGNEFRDNNQCTFI